MFDSLKRNLSFVLVVIMGVAAISSFYFFYTKQKHFSTAQKEFLIALDTLKIDKHELNYLILKNYIYAYNNNDEISKKLKKLEEDFEHLIQTDIFVNPNYTLLQKDIGYLKNKIDELFQNTQRYLMFNASIKNSLLYLASHQKEFAKWHKQELLEKSAQIVQSLFLAKRINDLLYLQQQNKLQSNPNYPKKLQRIIQLFNMHASYVVQNLPLLMRLKESIITSDILTLIESIEERFAQIALQDSTILDRFTILLLLVFAATFIFLVIMLLRYKKEHMSLIQTTDSLRYSLKHDILTGLKNRYAFEIDKRELTHPMAILINIDRFKDLNDVFGNSIGDRLLVETGRLIAGLAKKHKAYVDTYRVGGDEFCTLFSGITTHKALQIAQEFEHNIAQTTFKIEGNDLNITITIAINCNPPLLENADLALKHIKRKHTQKVIVYDETLALHQQAKKNIETIKMVKQALKEDRVTPYFQPIVNLKSGKVEKFEALVRIIDGDKVVPPFFFLDVTRKTHLYLDITHMMLEKTFQVATQYPNHRFSINLSIADITDDALVESLFALYQKHILIANRIDIELLETEELYDIPKIQNFIERIHSFGSLVLIDDFGSGYSNFSYFTDLEIDILKIDGSIIQEITSNKRKYHILESIVMFAKSMNLKIVAEFVDDPQIIPILKQLDIEYAQGYLFSMPQPEPVLNLNYIKR